MMIIKLTYINEVMKHASLYDYWSIISSFKERMEQIKVEHLLSLNASLSIRGSNKKLNATLG